MAGKNRLPSDPPNGSSNRARTKKTTDEQVTAAPDIHSQSKLTADHDKTAITTAANTCASTSTQRTR